ncbi:hypothetical protein BCT07_11805 [Vibrio breoganii]|nr:hypothetical protein BCT07_11805 [Vibrio breoganii]
MFITSVFSFCGRENKDTAPMNIPKLDTQTLARVMSCSTRNVAKTMKNLADLGWIKWQPGRGRGIKTQLHIVHSFHYVLSSAIKSYYEYRKDLV